MLTAIQCFDSNRLMQKMCTGINDLCVFQVMMHLLVCSCRITAPYLRKSF